MGYPDDLHASLEKVDRGPASIGREDLGSGEVCGGSKDESIGQAQLRMHGAKPGRKARVAPIGWLDPHAEIDEKEIHHRQRLDGMEATRSRRPSAGMTTLNEPRSNRQTRVRRQPTAAHHERDTIYGVLDDALVAHVGMADGSPLLSCPY